MGDSQIFPSAAHAGFTSRSMGVKLIVVCGLAAFMALPMFFVGSLVDDRASRAAGVIREISGSTGGRQTFLGPTLAIPYTNPARRDVYVVFPAQASAVLKTTTEERHRSLFKVPVFQADATFAASFDLTGVPAIDLHDGELDWSRAQIVVGVSDARGALADATVTVNGKTMVLVPADVPLEIKAGGQGESRNLALFAARMDGIASQNARFDVSSSLRFSGAQRVAVLAYGKNTRLSVQGDWPSPGFDGGFPPVRRTVAGSGFSAEWFVPYIARGVRAEATSGSLGGLQSSDLGTSFIEVADPYQSVNRSIKYVLLFLGLIFLSYFVFESTTGRRVHPAQYILVGIAQIIFYLLLLSLAERIGFDWGFLLAGGATVSLLSLNAGWIFSSRWQALKALATFSSLYALIYLLLRMEENALLVGAIGSFLAVAAAMYLTRRIDWYNPFGSAGARDSTHAPVNHSF